MSKPCKCGSTEHESVTSRGLAGMTTITSCPVEVAEAHQAMQEPTTMEVRVIEVPITHSFLHIDRQIDIHQKGFSNITQFRLDKVQVEEMISALDSNHHVLNMRADKRFTWKELSKSIVSDPHNSFWSEHYDVFENNKQLDNLLNRGEYQPYAKTPHIWREIHLTDVERHAVQMIMLINDMKDTYTMMLTEGEEE